MRWIVFVLIIGYNSVVAAEEGSSCSDCAAYKSAKDCLSQIKYTPGRTTASFIAEREVILKYHRRRSDPDSILQAARQLLQATPAYSESYAFAAFSIAESHLHLLQEAAYEQARALLRPDQYAASLRPLLGFYLLLLDAKYDHKFTLNAERLSIRLINALIAAPRFLPEVIPELTVALCDAYSYLGLLHLIIEQVEYFKAEIKPQIKDELDAIKYDHYLGRIFQFIKRYQKATNLQEKAIERLSHYPENLTSLLAQCNYYAGDACYSQYRDESCLLFFEQAVQIKRRKEYIELYVAILYHTRQYDRVIEECQRFFSETIPGFQPNGPLDNPELKNGIMSGEHPGNLMMWKGRALYKKSIDQPDELAIPWLECGLAAAENGRILHNRLMFKADGYKIAQLILNNQNTYGLGYQMRIAYQLWLRTKSHAYKKLFFQYMEMRKNYLLSDAFDWDYLPKAAHEQIDKHAKALESLEYEIMDAPGKDNTTLYQELLLRSEKLDQYVAAIKRSHPRPIMDHAQLSYADPDELQQKLDDSTAIIVCAQQWKHYYVYIITASGQYLSKIQSSRELSDWLATLKRTVSDPLQMQYGKRQKFIRASHRIYTAYLGPFERELAGKTRLVIIPEELSGQIPFEVLLDSDEDKPYEDLNYLVKDREISYHYSATFYDKEQETYVQDGSFLGFAPVFDEGGTLDKPERSLRLLANRLGNKRNGIKRNTFTSLPATAKEVTTITNLLPPNSRKTVLLRSDATVGRLATALRQDHQYVHLATHGLPNLLDPRRSAFACYDTTSSRGSFLYAHHVESLNLKADLAVLSSCDSGVGMILEGENIIALSRSFLVAGTNNIVYSLWKVNDQITSDLMINFYRGHLHGKPYAAALRKVKLDLIANPETAAPRFWSPFVIVSR